MDEKKALEIFEECIDEMYCNSVPPTTWKDIKEKYGGTKNTFYDKHTMTEETYEKIKEKYVKQLPKIYKDKLDWFLLDYAPTFKDQKK